MRAPDMKICMISYHCCPFSMIGGNGVGGMNVYLKELSSRLTEFPGVSIDIFTRDQSQRQKKIHKISSSLRVIHLKGGPERSFDRKDLYDFLPEFCRSLEDFIREEGSAYDLVYSHYWLSGMAGEWIKNRFCLPQVHTFHTLGFLKEKALGKGEHECRDYMESHLASSTDIIISSSFEERSRLNARYGIPVSKQRVIYPGVNKDMFYPVQYNEIVSQETGWRDDSLRLLYVGRIEPVKGLMSVVESLAVLKEADPPVFRRLKLAVIGGGRKERDFIRNQELQRIQNYIKSRNLEGNVRFLGSKRQEELRNYYSAADALVVPSLYESFGLVVVEALACGTPVIVSQVGKMQSIVREGRSGFSFEPGSPVSLSKCLQQFPSSRDNLWDSASIRTDVIHRFSWTKTAAETYEVLSSLLEKVRLLRTTLRPDGKPLPAESFLPRPCP